MRVFQKRMLSGNPSRSRGPGSSSRKKSASWASNDRRPFGTIWTGWLSEVAVAGVGEGVPEEPDAIEGDGGNTAGWDAGEPSLLLTGADSWLTGCSARKWRRYSARSFAVM